MVSQNSSCRVLSLSTCFIFPWGIDEPVFKFVCGFRGDGYASPKLWRCSIRKSGMGGPGGIGMFN